MLASLLPAGMAAFDQCARSSGEWVGFDQGIGSSTAQAVTHSGTNVYVGGYACGALSFGSRHKDGKYHDHVGINQVHDTISDVTIHHETASMAASAGTRNTDPLSSQLGQDSIIYKLSDAGMPVSVYAMDTMPSDGIINGTSRNGGWGGWSYINGLDDFDLSGETDQIAAVGMVRGSIKFPKAGEAPMELLNIKNGKYDPWVAKIDMAAGGSVVWATKAGIELRESPEGCMKDGDDLGDGVKCVQNSAYPVSVVTTLAGHVITTTRTYISRKYAGVMSKFNGLTGALVWSHTFGDGLYQRYGKMSVSGETAYMTARFKGKDSADLLAASSCEDGTEDSVVVAAFDVSPSDAPKASWATVIGCGNREGGSFVEGEYIYASGRLSAASILTPADGVTAAACTMAGDLGGFLVKLKKADGKCMWAKDLGTGGNRIVANAEFVWTADYSSSDFKFDADHVVKPAGDDVIMGKFSASDGAGLWGDLLGAEGRDRVYDLAMTLQGPVAVGYSSSTTIAVGAVTAENLQQVDKATNGGPGKNAMYAIQMSMDDTFPMCIGAGACPSGKLTDAVITANHCYIEGKCLVHDAPSPRLPCFKCDANTNQRALPALPILTEHCYFDETCHAKGAAAPSYARYGSTSVCETCEPAVDPNAWTLTSGFFHDRDTASQRNAGVNDYGLYFTSRSNGCQLLPNMPTPNAPSTGLNAANANPTLSTVAGIGARTTSAISVVKGATGGNQGAEAAWAWYHGDSTKCMRHAVQKDVCKDTPSALSDAMSMHFETNLHYGHSIARVKVQQVLAILQSDLVTPSADRSIADLKMDIVAHMLIPHYQGAIHAAHEIDTGQRIWPNDGTEHWKVINAAVTSFSASERAQLTEMFSPTASGTMNFCTVQAHLLKNLPGGSNLQYGSNDCIKEGCKEIGTHTPGDDATKHVTEEDVGILKASREGDAVKDCSVLAMPPPSPPPPPPIAIGTETVVYKFTAAGAVSDFADTTALQEKFADAANVDKTMVSIKVTAASVIIEVTITVPKDKLAATVKARLTSNLTSKTKDEQSKILGVTVETVAGTVVKDSAPVVKKPDSDSGLSEGEIAGVAIGAAVGGIVLLGIVGLILRSLMFKEAKPVFTCLEKAPAAKKDASPA